jgi:hypothetical protein
MYRWQTQLPGLPEVCTLSVLCGEVVHVQKPRDPHRLKKKPLGRRYVSNDPGNLAKGWGKYQFLHVWTPILHMSRGGLTIKFSSGTGCKDFKPRNAVMPAPSAATVGSARIATTSPSPGCRPPPAAHHLLPRASIAAGSPRRSCERRSWANAAIASPAIQGGG